MAESLVALRDRREQVISRLSEGYAQDLFDVDELERRLDLAHRAASVAELEVLVADLGEVAAPATTALVVAGPRAIDDPGRAAKKKLNVIMSSVERRGRWSVPKHMVLRSMWGHVELDFRDASLGPGVTEIEVLAVMANVEVVLPPNLAIDVDVSTFAGNVTERHRVPPEADPARPMIRITGKVVFGNVEITTRLDGESAHDAYKREKRERKALRKADKRLRKAEKHGLPPGS
ncbi:MAG TPA: DUF1707 domain-containing protein [Kofleriaceae bacterium]|nr:DUF1707 domain-containing protein [Kofleriaceae bacterium]